MEKDTNLSLTHFSLGEGPFVQKGDEGLGLYSPHKTPYHKWFILVPTMFSGTK